MDSTHFQTYGNQYGNEFHPLMVFDGMTGDCLKVELRAGNSTHPVKQVSSFDGYFTPHEMSFHF